MIYRSTLDDDFDSVCWRRVVCVVAAHCDVDAVRTPICWIVAFWSGRSTEVRAGSSIVLDFGYFAAALRVILDDAVTSVTGLVFQYCSVDGGGDLDLVVLDYFLAWKDGAEALGDAADSRMPDQLDTDRQVVL